MFENITSTSDKIVPPVNTYTDEPLNGNTYTAPKYSEIKSNEREDKKVSHILFKDKLVSVAGFILILILMYMGKVMVDVTLEKEVVHQEFLKDYLSLISSAVMLILGYLFGSRNGS